MRISDWCSDVCSSDLKSTTPIDFDSLPAADLDVPAIYDNDQFSQELQLLYEGDKLNGVFGFYYLDANAFTAFDVALFTTGDLLELDRKRVVTGKSVSVLVDLGGRRTNTKKTPK